MVKDLRVPNQKSWNVQLVKSLFTPHTAEAILQTPIVNASGQDVLVWKLTPTGEYTSKRAYKHCFNNLTLPASQRPKIVPPQVVYLLNQIWREKSMVPRVQTFAWRLLRRALPTGKRVSKFSKHISENCARCGSLEDKTHMFFLCPFSKTAWFSSPWYIRSEMLAMHNLDIPQMIKALLDSNHPGINIVKLYTFLWCIWKARNDALFARKFCKPSQVYPAANAILQGSKLEEMTEGQDQCSPTTTVHQEAPQQEPSCSIGQHIHVSAL